MFCKRFILVGCFVALPATAALAQSAPAQRECRTETIDFAGRPETALYCLDPDGVWRALRHHRDDLDDNDQDDNDGDARDSGDAAPVAHAAPPAPAYVAPQEPARQPATALDRSLDAIALADSRSWLFWRYDAGSMTGAKVLSRVRKGNVVTLYGEYTYNGGSPGWVKVVMRGGQLNCLEFWNEGACRAPGNPPSHAIVGGIVRAMATGGGGSGGGGSGNGMTPQQQQNYDYDRARQNQQNIQDQVDRSSAPQ